MPLRRASDAVERPPPPPPRDRGPILRKLALLAGLLGLVAVVGLGLWVRPWVVGPPLPPDEVDAAWDQVVAWGAAGPGSSGDVELLLRAVEVLRPVREEAKDLLAGPDAVKWPDPPEEAVQAAELLVRWSEQGGGLGADPCLQGLPLRALDLLTLGEVGIALADRGDDPRLAAALALGAQLRERGGIVKFAVGGALAERGLDAASDQDSALGALRAHRPTAAEVFPALAREARCFYAVAEANIGTDMGLMGLNPELPGSLASVDRELAMLRWTHGVRLAEARAAGDDLAALVAILEEQDRRELPASLLVQIVVLAGYPTLVAEAAAVIARYDAHLERR
jgi:hypothetical protein